MSKILIADDEQEALDVLSDFLTDLGHDIAVADDGEKAVEKIKGETYDIVILDLKMPRISGEGVLEVIARESPQTKVIITTGYSDGGQTEARVQKLNVSAFIEKPIDLMRLDECIRQIIDPANE
jgi:DNA-binding NtrC family response regulator